MNEPHLDNGSIRLLVQFLLTKSVKPLSGFDCTSFHYTYHWDIQPRMTHNLERKHLFHTAVIWGCFAPFVAEFLRHEFSLSRESNVQRHGGTRPFSSLFPRHFLTWEIQNSSNLLFLLQTQKATTWAWLNAAVHADCGRDFGGWISTATASSRGTRCGRWQRECTTNLTNGRWNSHAFSSF